MNILYSYYLTRRVNNDLKDQVFSSPDEAPELVFSPYVCEQLSRYSTRRDLIISRHRLPAEIPDREDRLISGRITLNEGLDRLDGAISQITAAITSEAVQFKNKLAALDQDRKLYIKDQAPHMIQLCNNREAEVCKEYYQNVVQLHKRIIAMLHAQNDLIGTAENTLKPLQSRYLEHIDVYYSRVTGTLLRRRALISPAAYPNTLTTRTLNGAGSTIKHPTLDDLCYAGDPRLLSDYHMQKREYIQQRIVEFQTALHDIEAQIGS